jgi:hypothetical protein
MNCAESTRSAGPDARRRTGSSYPTPNWVREVRNNIREVRGDLTNHGLKLFPATQAGLHAHLLWCHIRQRLFLGGTIGITLSALQLRWHRQELKRARDILVEMELIRPRPDGLYVLGRYARLDDEVRERFVELRAIEKVMVSFDGIMGKSKTHRRPRTDARHK